MGSHLSPWGKGGGEEVRRSGDLYKYDGFRVQRNTNGRHKDARRQVKGIKRPSLVKEAQLLGSGHFPLPYRRPREVTVPKEIPLGLDSQLKRAGWSNQREGVGLPKHKIARDIMLPLLFRLAPYIAALISLFLPNDKRPESKQRRAETKTAARFSVSRCVQRAALFQVVGHNSGVIFVGHRVSCFDFLRLPAREQRGHAGP